MKKRTVAWTLAVICLLVGAVGFYWNFFAQQSISISQSDLQSRIDAKMPFQAKHGVVVSQATVVLGAGEIALDIAASTHKFGKDYSLNARGKGVLTYDNDRGAFYFRPEALELKNIQSNGAPVKIGSKVGSLVDKLSDKLNAPKLQDDKEQLIGAAEAISQQLVQKAAETVLAVTPVYKIPDTVKGQAIRMFLESVEVKDGVVIAHLSLWQFTMSVLAFGIALMAAVGIVGALLLCPEWGIAAIALTSL